MIKLKQQVNLRKSSGNIAKVGKIAAIVSLKLFIKGYEISH